MSFGEEPPCGIEQRGAEDRRMNKVSHGSGSGGGGASTS